MRNPRHKYNEILFLVIFARKVVMRGTIGYIKTQIFINYLDAVNFFTMDSVGTS